ncbi:MAG: hypothetical protein RLY61_904 [Candidatus Parcubacteria bacterium]
MFLFKKKKVVLDCFTYRSDVYSYFPIQKASSAMPNWWKKMPATFCPDPTGLAEFPTMRSCSGFLSYYNNAISLPLWTDTKIRTSVKDDIMHWHFSDGVTQATPHDLRQKGEYLTDPMAPYTHLKIVSPWIFHCKEDIQFVYSGNTWALNNPEQIIIPPGVVNYKYQSVSSINMFIRMNGTQIASIDAGTSLVHIFPMTEREVEIKTHIIEEKDFRNMENLGANNFTAKSYFKHKHLIQEHEKTGKCPVSGFFKV